MIIVLLMGGIGALIGLITNAIAIILLFRPYKKVFGFQGLIPRRINDIAKKIGEVVENELIDTGELLSTMIDQLNMSELKQKVGKKISLAIRSELPAFVPGGLIDKIIFSYLDRKGEELFVDILHDFTKDSTNLAQISHHVEEQILKSDLPRIERIVRDVAQRELNFIVILGAILGLAIGILQGFVALYLI